MDYAWRGEFTNVEVNALHAEAFGTHVYDESEWNWRELTDRHSLGWVTAREGEQLLGFVNVLWDGLVHAWLQDTMVAADARHRGSVRPWSSGRSRAPGPPAASTCTWTSTSTSRRSTSMRWGSAGRARASSTSVDPPPRL